MQSRAERVLPGREFESGHGPQGRAVRQAMFAGRRRECRTTGRQLVRTDAVRHSGPTHAR